MHATLRSALQACLLRMACSVCATSCACTCPLRAPHLLREASHPRHQPERSDCGQHPRLTSISPSPLSMPSLHTSMFVTASVGLHLSRPTGHSVLKLALIPYSKFNSLSICLLCSSPPLLDKLDQGRTDSRIETSDTNVRSDTEHGLQPSATLQRGIARLRTRTERISPYLSS